MNWFVIFLISSAYAEKNIFISQSVVTKGAHFSEITNVILYSDVELVIEPLQDIPSIKFDFQHDCESCGPVLFNTSEANHKAIKATYELISTLAETFSFKGLDYSAFEKVSLIFRGKNLTTETNDETFPLPRDEEIETIGRDMYNSIVQKIELRSLLESKKQIRQQRSPIGAVVRMLPTALKLSSKLFLPTNGILNILLGLAPSKPNSLLNFATSPNYVSKIAKVSIAGLKTILNQLDTAEATESKWKEKAIRVLKKDFLTEGQDSYNHGPKAAFQYILDNLGTLVEAVKKLFSNSMEMSSQMGQMTLMTNLITQHLLYYNALQACRDGSIPPTFLPPSLLKQRVLSLLNILPPEMELAININDLHRLYTIRNTKCFFDTEGAIMEINIPLKRRDETFNLYHLKSLHFAYQNQTCSINVESGYVALESNSGQVLPIRRDDKDTCQPHLQKTCFVNQLTSGGWEEDTCVETILGGGSAVEIDNACRMTCTKSTRLKITQIDEVTFVIAHVPKTGTSIHCDGFDDLVVAHNFERGAFRFFLAPHCVILINGKIVARATHKANVRRDTPVAVQHILPSQWIYLDDWIAYDHNKSPEISFKNITPILVDNWLELETSGTPTSVGTNPPSFITLINSVVNSVQTAVIIFILYKFHMMSLLLMQNNLPAEARSTLSCTNIDEMYTYIYVIMALLLSIIVPKFGVVIINRVKSVWSFTVKKAAIKKIQEADAISIA